MKRTTLIIAVATIMVHLAFEPSIAISEDAFQVKEIVLYNKLDEFTARSPTAEVLASFIKQLKAKAATLWMDEKPTSGKSGFVAVAIRPNKTMKLWIDVEGKFQPEITASLQGEMKSIGVPQVKKGPIAFAVHFDLWGGKPKAKTERLQIPQSWRKAVDGQSKTLIIPDDLLPLVWKNESSPENKSTFFVPEGYEVQELKPAGGKILRPKGWFYTEGHRKHVLMWTVSKEDVKKGPYETGVRIQFLAGVQKNTGKSPEEFIQSFVDGKKKTASIINERPMQTQGLFTRIGLETKETLALGGKREPYHILYSCFWGNEADLVVLVTSGTTVDLWEEYADTFDAMSGFELIDMKKFRKNVGVKATSVQSEPRP